MKRPESDRKKLAWRLALIAGFIVELVMIAVSVVSISRDSYEFSYGQTMAYIAIAIWIYIAYLKQRHADVSKFVVDEKIKTHAIIENLKEAVLVIDGRSVVMLYNSRAARMLGIQDVEWIGKDLAGKVDDAVRQSLESGFEGEIEGSILSGGGRFRLQIISLGGSEESAFRLIFLRKVVSSPMAAGHSGVCTNAGRVAHLIAEMQSTLAGVSGGADKESAVARARLLARASIARVELEGQDAKEKIGQKVLSGVLERRLIPVVDLIKPAVEEISGAAALAGVSVEFPYASVADLKAAGDGTLLALAIRQVLFNAVLEAIPGGKVVIRAGEMGSNVGIAVLDSGASIAPDAIGELYALDYVGARTGSNDPARVHGSGYYLARGIVEAHGGTVTVESPSEGGVRVVIMLQGAS